jgi:RNA polymerase sigma-70 factor (ECF subfamily)
MDDNAALMQRVSGGDTHAFRILVERYQKPMYNFFLRSTGSVEDAEDLAQQLFLNLYASASRYKPRASFKTYIYRIASNMAVSFARKARVRDSVSLETLAEGGIEPPVKRPDADPAREFERRELQRNYSEALLRLPVEWRTAIELRVGRELSYREIAETIGKSVPAVESILFRARERLALEMGKGSGGETRDDNQE